MAKRISGLIAQHRPNFARERSREPLKLWTPTTLQKRRGGTDQAAAKRRALPTLRSRKSLLSAHCLPAARIAPPRTPPRTLADSRANRGNLWRTHANLGDPPQASAATFVATRRASANPGEPPRTPMRNIFGAPRTSANHLREHSRTSAKLRGPSRASANLREPPRTSANLREPSRAVPATLGALQGASPDTSASSASLCEPPRAFVVLPGGLRRTPANVCESPRTCANVYEPARASPATLGDLRRASSDTLVSANLGEAPRTFVNNRGPVTNSNELPRTPPPTWTKLCTSSQTSASLPCDTRRPAATLGEPCRSTPQTSAKLHEASRTFA